MPDALAASAALQPNKGGSREPVAWPIEGFERDLVAVEALQKAKAKLTPELLRAGMLDGRLAVRVNSVRALALHGPPSDADLDVVLVLLKDGSASVRSAATRALAGAQPSDKVIPALIRAQLADPKAHADIAEVMRGYGTDAVAALMPCLRCDGEEADRAALPYLLQLGAPAQAALGKALVHPDARMRANALAGLMLFGTHALQENHRVVIALGRDHDLNVRTLARQALTRVSRASSPPFAEVRPLPIEAMDAQLADEPALKKAAKALESSALLALTRDGRDLVRANAWRGLGALGPLDAAASLQAAVATRDSDVHVRREACLALRQCPEAVLLDVTGPLLLATRDREKPVAQAARQALLSQGKRTVGLLVENLANPSPTLQDAAITMLVTLEQDAAPAVTKALASPQPPVRENALIALGEIGGKGLEAATDQLVELTRDHIDGVRAQALRTLARLSDATLKARRETLMELGRKAWREDAALVVRNAGNDLANKIMYLR
ncbi:MAG: HEAT repeat domain-containing protein [Deltaproteobacteria bacterium]|nr:HEAT repeat domain-containing protein [Deltaproteobacteria bacterium]